MTTASLKQFDASIHKTNQWINELMDDLGWDSRANSYHALRTVLHALRDRLTVEEAVDLSAQLPMLIRGFYFEGWQPSHVPVHDRTSSDFLQRVHEGFGDNKQVDVEQVTRAVLRVLSNHVSAGEVKDIQHCLPDSIRELWQ